MEERIEALRRSLAADARIETAFVFGSVARGTARRDSDLDLAIRYTPGVDHGALAREQLEFLGRLVLAAKAEVHLIDLERASPALIHAVLRDGKPLFDRDPARTRRQFAAALVAHADGDWQRRALDTRLKAQLAARHG